MVEPTERKYFDILISFDNAGLPIWKMLYKGSPCIINDEGKQFVVDTLHEVEDEVKNKIKNNLYEANKHQ